MSVEVGLVRLQEHWLNEAEANFQQVLGGDVANPAALHFLGITACKLGRPDEGINWMRRAVAVEPGRTLAWLDLAVALRDAGHATDALSAYRHALNSLESMKVEPFSRFDELLRGGRYAYQNMIQTLPVHSTVESIPPLEHLAFSVERTEYSFKFLDYKYRAKARYGGGRPPHTQLFEVIASERARYAEFIGKIAQLERDFAKISLRAGYFDQVPFWLNTWLAPLDAMALYAMLSHCGPRLFVEIGSGMSTKFARRAIATHGLGTRMVSIDPEPRSDIDPQVDEIIRRPLEDIDPQFFDQLKKNDFLFFDGSHRVFQNSDVAVFFLEILPNLKPGVVVHLHDIYLPYDYPAGHLPRLWSEQYLLATILLFAEGAFELLFPSWFVSCDNELSTRADELLRKGLLSDLSIHGNSFWLRVRRPQKK